MTGLKVKLQRSSSKVKGRTRSKKFRYTGSKQVEHVNSSGPKLTEAPGVVYSSLSVIPQGSDDRVDGAITTRYLPLSEVRLRELYPFSRLAASISSWA